MIVNYLGVLIVMIGAGTPLQITKNTLINTKSITLSSDGTNCYLYADDVLIDSGAVGTIDTLNDDYIYIGNDFYGNQNFGDNISNVLLYDFALTATEVALLG